MYQVSAYVALLYFSSFVCGCVRVIFFLFCLSSFCARCSAPHYCYFHLRSRHIAFLFVYRVAACLPSSLCAHFIFLCVFCSTEPCCKTLFFRLIIKTIFGKHLVAETLSIFPVKYVRSIYRRYIWCINTFLFFLSCDVQKPLCDGAK